VVAFSFGRGTYEEIARKKIDDGTEIRAITVKQFIEGRNSLKDPVEK
jgi:hypothetical protein